MKLLLQLFVLVIAVVGINSCGMQGDLYLPEKNTEQPADSPAAE